MLHALNANDFIRSFAFTNLISSRQPADLCLIPQLAYQPSTLSFSPSHTRLSALHHALYMQRSCFKANSRESEQMNIIKKWEDYYKEKHHFHIGELTHEHVHKVEQFFLKLLFENNRKCESDDAALQVNPYGFKADFKSMKVERCVFQPAFLF